MLKIQIESTWKIKYSIWEKISNLIFMKMGIKTDYSYQWTVQIYLFITYVCVPIFPFDKGFLEAKILFIMWQTF